MSEETSRALHVAEPLARAGRHCATIARLKYRSELDRGLVPNAGEPTGTVTFVSYEGRTYAVTAAHVISTFDNLRKAEGRDLEGYHVPAKPGVAIAGPFLTPPHSDLFGGRTLDVAICPVNSSLPGRVGKEAFAIDANGDPSWPVSHALAVGFPTDSKLDLPEAGGVRLGMRCVHALAEGVGGSGTSDQVQFYSELPERPELVSLSGMSGGPVFWSTEEGFGLVGFVKEALDVEPKPGEDTLYAGPRVHFLCQRVDHALIGDWARYVDDRWPAARAEQSRLVEERELARQASGGAERGSDQPDPDLGALGEHGVVEVEGRGVQPGVGPGSGGAEP